ncbi:MAG TPA: DNA mismatch repair protein MutS [candidate division Zixibacteria bacterium]|nr:DNA mismatch repair protein MutS [candidate division Zixibacteria bacterium]
MSKAPHKASTLTPLMQQFHAIKEQHPDKILFFRMGDFYEMFGDDAVRAAPLLNITLTSRSHGEAERIPLAGVPHHSADKYLARLLEKGEKVVVVEQVEDPRTAKGIVKRDIVEILTPGTATIDGVDDGERSLCLAAIKADGKKQLGLAALDLSTGSFVVDQDDEEEVLQRLKILEPEEILFPDDYDPEEIRRILELSGRKIGLTSFGAWNFDARTADRELNRHFETSTLDGFGLRDCKLGVAAAGAILRYLKENHRDHLGHIRRMARFDDNQTMTLDYNSVRNLELTRNLSDGSEENTLLATINRCVTAAGIRRLRQAILHPFKRHEPIERRLAGVAELTRQRDLSAAIRETLSGLPDIEKLAGRLGIGKLNPRQAAALGAGLKTASEVKEILDQANSPVLTELRAGIPDSSHTVQILERALVDEPPLTATKGNIFREGYSDKLDALNDSIRDARRYIGSLQEKERQRTKITTLKVGYNKVFGYYLEVTKANAEAVPEEYIRKQTLVNAERYITPELKEKEDLILTAEEKIFRLEEDLFSELAIELEKSIEAYLLTGQLLAELDLVAALAEIAVQNGYCRPEIYQDTRLVIEGGRHAVIEAVLPSGQFVANDTRLATDGDAIAILTGPNMSGKSTYLRQIGLIVILAQIGSFVPAERAEIGLVDRVFTRVGALDNLARGQSTFLVEMVETANILNNATERSLVLLDEVGRGTSTFDGLSVAWAVVEHINEHNLSRTVFATHYHELTSLAQIYDRVKNYQVTVRKWESQVLFLHQIIEGGCDDSYGIEVARLAGVPRQAIARARQILRLLESGKFNQSELGKGILKERLQPSLFDPQPSATEEAIRELDLENMTPLEALNLLKKLKEDLS